MILKEKKKKKTCHAELAFTLSHFQNNVNPLFDRAVTITKKTTLFKQAFR